MRDLDRMELPLAGDLPPGNAAALHEFLDFAPVPSELAGQFVQIKPFQRHVTRPVRRVDASWSIGGQVRQRGRSASGTTGVQVAVRRNPIISRGAKRSESRLRR